MEQNRRGPGGEGFPPEEEGNIGNDILNLLGERTKTPGEAFVLLQQLTIFIWDQYKIDWKDHDGHKVADNRKQRYLDFASELIDSIKTGEQPASGCGCETQPGDKSDCDCECDCGCESHSSPKPAAKTRAKSTTKPKAKPDSGK